MNHDGPLAWRAIAPPLGLFVRQFRFMVQQFKCRLGYNGAAAAGHRWRLCACLDRVTLRYSCEILKQKEIEMGILSDDKKQTSFLAKEDCPGVGKQHGLLATIVDFTMQNLAKPNESPEHKPILHTKEHSPMVLNPTNRDWLLDRFGDDQRCVGKKVNIWHDPDVEYPRGKKVGGLRIADYMTDDPTEPFHDDIPFGD